MSDPSIVSLRLPGAIAEQVRTLAERADEKQSVILRRLIKLGLLAEGDSRSFDRRNAGEAV